MQQQSHLTEFTEAQRAEALRHFQIIRPFLEDGVPLTHIATEQQLQLRTLRRWVQHYRAQGPLRAYLQIAMSLRDTTVFDHIGGTHFAHEKGPTTCKMITQKGPTHTTTPVFSFMVTFVRSDLHCGDTLYYRWSSPDDHQFKGGPTFMIKKWGPGTHFHDQKQPPPMKLLISGKVKKRQG